MSSDISNVEILQGYVGDLASGNKAKALETLTEDVEFNPPGPADILPWEQSYIGRDAVSEFLDLCAQVCDSEVELGGIVAQDDKVVVLAREKVTAKATGKSLEHDLVAVYTFSGGKIARCQLYEDNYGLAQIFSQT